MQFSFIDRESDDGTNYYLRKGKTRIIKFPQNQKTKMEKESEIESKA